MKVKESIENIKINTAQAQTCFHCGDSCDNSPLLYGDKKFCCDGCRAVYQLLNENDLCTYYSGDIKPGVNAKAGINIDKYEFLENENVQRAYIRFKNKTEVHVNFYLPSVHCQSCVWLLEKLHRLNNGIVSSRLNFDKKEISIIYNPAKTNLREVVSTLASVGYEPHLSLNDLEAPKSEKKPAYKSRLYKLGIAGFCFGNIMLFSFPEYLGMTHTDEFIFFFSWINFALALPVFFYSASEFSVPAWKAVRHGFVSVDIPVFLAILVTFVRSSIDVIAGWGPGFFDSMTGIVFFMLAGRVFQDKSYNSVSFYRNYRSYLPVSVAVIKNKEEHYKPVNEIKPGDILVIRNNEIVPVDGTVVLGYPHMDYSFVTGETALVKVNQGDTVYAGGKHLGQAIQMMAEKEVSQSYLTSLWNHPRLNKPDEMDLPDSFVHKLAVKFTWLVLAIAVGSAAVWLFYDAMRAFNAFTAVLIVACPCALLLSSSFTYGNMLRIFGRNGLFLRNPTVIEKMGAAKNVVFDKTGTITSGKNKTVEWKGNPLPGEIKTVIASMLYHSQHPNSRIVSSFLKENELMEVKNFTEIPGKGLSAVVGGILVKAGSVSWCNAPNGVMPGRAVHISVSDKWLGYFDISTQFRTGLKETMEGVTRHSHIALVSGDNDHEKNILQSIFPLHTPMYFNYSPDDKKQFIHEIKSKGSTIMIGDGLNDVAALKESDVGIAVTEQMNNFTPSSDAVLNSASFSLLPGFLQFAKSGRSIITWSFIISLIYNTVGLAFAVQGTFSPLLAAILMPLSTVSIIVFTTVAGNITARKCKLLPNF